MYSKLNKIFNVAIIGLGNIGYKYDCFEKEKKIQSHANAFSRNKNFKIIAVVEKNENSRKDFRKFYPNIAVYKDTKSLKNLDIDILVISSPTDTHKEVVYKAVKNIKPKLILLEKPISYTLNNSKSILDLCNKNKILLYINFIRSADPAVKKIKNLIDHKKILGPFKVIASYTKGLLHNGSHFFDLMHMLFGKPQKIILNQTIKLYKNGDGLLNFIVKYENAEVNFIASKDKSDTGNQIDIYFQKGILSYQNGGRQIYIRRFKKGSDIIIQEREIKSFIDTYQKYVVDEIAKIMHKKKTSLRSGSDAYLDQKFLNKILNKSKCQKIF